ncbi:acyl carrier protein [bacterium]|nr:acyl carrier protein [bacterium]
MQNLEQDIRGLVAEIIEKDPKEITKDADFVKDLGVDSMMVLELLASLEKKYRIIIPEESLMKFKSLSETIKLVESFLKRK